MDKTACVSVVKAGTEEYIGEENGSFRPGKPYPEYPFTEYAQTENAIYDAVREALILLKMDEMHLGTKDWNPLADIIQPGDNVLIKPNMVQERNNNPEGGTTCLYTEPAVIAPVLDYVFKALAGTGSVTVGDAPMQECNFEKLAKEAGYDRLVAYYKVKGLNIQLVDFRKHVTEVKQRIMYKKLRDDVPARVVNLGEQSEYYGLDEESVQKLRIINYPHDNLVAHHNGDVQEYCVSQYVLDADVVINMPKPKTHKKAGITAALKNLVGINAQKDFLPHHMFGARESGGDEYRDNNAIQAFRGNLYDRKYKYEDEGKFFRARMVWLAIACCTTILMLVGTEYQNGSWYGNHTISRTIADLNKILFYVDKNGVLQDHVVRREFIVADMIVSGEKNGPVAPSPKKCGVIMAGSDPVCFDEAVATMMGFEPKKIPTLVQIHNVQGDFPVFRQHDNTMLVSNINGLNGKRLQELKQSDVFHFIPADGWKGHIEKDT